MALFFYRILYFLRESFKNVRYSLFLNIVSVFTIAVSLVLVGFFAFLLLNAGRFLDEVAQDLRISVYLNDDITPEQIDALALELRRKPEVEEIEVVTRAEDRRRSMALLSPMLLEGLDEQSIPAQASIEIGLKKRSLRRADIEEVDQWLRQITEVDAVDDALFGADQLRVLHAGIDLIQTAGLIVSMIILLAAVFFTFSTIKLAVYARQQEIEILRLVGATHRFIRVPFYLEGILQGLVGSLVALAILATMRNQVNSFVREVHLLNLEFELLPSHTLLLFVAGGVLLGFLGSALSISRYLRA